MMFIKTAVLLLSACSLLLTGCGDGNYAREVCLERDLKSGNCLSSKMTCADPMVLTADTAARPVCIMPRKNP